MKASPLWNQPLRQAFGGRLRHGPVAGVDRPRPPVADHQLADLTGRKLAVEAVDDAGFIVVGIDERAAGTVVVGIEGADHAGDLGHGVAGVERDPEPLGECLVPLDHRPHVGDPHGVVGVVRAGRLLVQEVHHGGDDVGRGDPVLADVVPVRLACRTRE